MKIVSDAINNLFLQQYFSPDSAKEQQILNLVFLLSQTASLKHVLFFRTQPAVAHILILRSCVEEQVMCCENAQQLLQCLLS